MSDNNKQVKGELVAFGADNYLHDPSKSMNYYAQIRTDDGKIAERWSKNLENVIKESGVRLGDTVVLTELGKEPIQIDNKTFNKTIWDLQKYEPVLDLPNVIEHDSEREQQKSAPAISADKTKENQEDLPSQPKKAPNLSDFEWQVPDNIKNNYIGIVKNRLLQDEKINYYDKNDKDQVNIAFEDRNKSLHTSRQDEKTIYAMLDLAQSKGWSAIKIKGTEEFKQKAWLEASLRGIEVKGYTPTEKDLAELQVKQEQRTTNQVEMTAQKPIEVKQNEKETEQIQAQKHSYLQLQNPISNQDYLDKIGVNFSGAKVEREALNRQEAQKQAESFTGKELTNTHSGVKAIISNANISKMASGKAFEKSANEKVHWSAIANADKLFANAIFAWQYQDRNADININAIHRAIAPMKLNDEVYVAKLTIKELAREEGNRVYSIEAVEVEQEKSPIPKMMNVDQDKQDFTQHRSNGALIDIIVKNAQEYNNQQQKNVSDLQNANTFNEPLPAQKTAQEIKSDIRQIFQDGYRDGSITSRDELVAVLKERGFEIKENEKSIRVSMPNSDQAVNLKGEVFTKGYDAVQSLKERLEPDNLKQSYPTLKDSDIVHITAYKNKLVDDYKDGKPKALQASLVQLEDSIKQMANGKEMNFPALPVNEIKPDIEVRTTDNHDKSRQV